VIVVEVIDWVMEVPGTFITADLTIGRYQLVVNTLKNVFYCDKPCIYSLYFFPVDERSNLTCPHATDFECWFFSTG
jgi:hypothetical protein